ncbi:transposase [Micromonospora sp. STR1s_5]|nr:transposase [Micromonospora sp. STR1s_5]
MATPARSPARQAQSRRPARHVPGGDRRLPHPGAQGWPRTGPSPVDRRKPGSKHHVITDAGGIPLAVSLTGSNRHDVTQFLPLVDKIPPVKGIRGRPRQRPERIYTDRGYDFDKCRRELRAKASPRSSPDAAPTTAQGSAPDAGRRTDHHPTALVPPPAHPLGDPRRHPRGLPPPVCAIICWRRLRHSKS